MSFSRPATTGSVAVDHRVENRVEHGLGTEREQLGIVFEPLSDHGEIRRLGVPDGDDEVLADEHVQLAELDLLDVVEVAGGAQHDEQRRPYRSSFGRWCAMIASSTASGCRSNSVGQRAQLVLVGPVEADPRHPAVLLAQLVERLAERAGRSLPHAVAVHRRVDEPGSGPLISCQLLRRGRGRLPSPWTPPDQAHRGRQVAAVGHAANPNPVSGRMGSMQDRAPRQEDLEPVERASVDELRALQLQRLQWSRAARLRQRPALPGGVRRGRGAPATTPHAGRPGRGSRSPRRPTCATTTRSACSPCPGPQVAAHPRLERHDRAARRSSATPADDIRTWVGADGPLDPRRGRPPRRQGARRVRVRAVHRRPGRALRRGGARLHGHPGVRAA